MSEQFADLVAVVRTDNTKLLTGLAQSNSKIASFASGITGNTALIAAGAIAAGAAIGMAINSSINAFADFDEQMTKSLSIMGNVSEGLRQQMADTALQLSTKSRFAATDLAGAYYFLASAGLDAEQSIASLSVVTDFATAGAFDLATATDLLTDAQSALGLTVKDTTQNMENMLMLSDALIKTNTLANASAQQFSEALTNEAGPAMRAFNVSVEGGLATLAAFADQGLKGNVAGSTFGRALRLLTKASLENESAFAKMNISVFDVAGEIRPMADVVLDLENALGGLSTKQRITSLKMLGFQARTQQAITPLLGMSEKIRQYSEEISKAGGITDEVANKQLDTLNAKLDMLTNKWERLKIVVGESYAPLKELAVNVLGPLIDVFEVLIRVNQVWTSHVVGSMRIIAAVIYDVVNSVVTRFQNAGIQIVNFFSDITKHLSGFAEAMVKLVSRDWSGAAKSLGKVFDDINKGTRDNIFITGATMEQEYNKVANNIGKLTDLFTGTSDALTSKGADKTGAKVASNVSQGLVGAGGSGGVASKLSGALERGSVAAFSAENKAARSQANIEQNTKDTAKNSNKQVSLLDNMNKQLMAGQTIVAGAITG